MKSLVISSAILGGIALSSTLFAQTQIFTTVGANTFTVPGSVISLKAEAIGGGGGGGRVKGTSARESGGGGGGAYARGIINVTAGTTYDVGVGVGGVQDNSVQSGRHGGASYFGSATSTDEATTVRAEGGKTVILNDGSNATGAEGGKAANSVGNIVKYNGGNGGSTANNSYGGGGGGAAGSVGAGGTGGANAGGTAGAGAYSGSGGLGGENGGDDDGTNGNNYGGGGGGARKSYSWPSEVNRYGSAGAQGIVVVSWSTISAVTPTTACQGDTITIEGTNFAGVDTVYINGAAADFTVVSPTTIKAVVGTNVSNSGIIIVNTENGKSGSADTLRIRQNTLTVTASDNQLSATYTGGSNPTYQWKNCVTNTIISGAGSSVFTPAANGLYAAIVTDGTCVFTSNCLPVSAVSIQEPLKNDGLLLYPNPSAGTVWYQSQQTISAISVKDMTGKVLLYKDVREPNYGSINLETLSKGVYFIELKGPHLRKTRSMVITR